MAAMPRRPTPPRTPLLARPGAQAGAGARLGGHLWPTVVAALLGALLCGVVQAPARWLAQAVTTASGGKLQLLNARGTVWNGQAHALFSGGADSQDRTLLPTPLRWRLLPRWRSALNPSGADTAPATAPLPPGDGPSGLGLSVALHTDCCTPQGLHLWLQPRWKGLVLTIDEHHSQWPATLLTGLGTPWNTLQLQAQVKLSTTGLALQWGPTGLQGTGTATLDVRDAASRLSTLRPMGSYRLVWQAGGSAPGGAPSLALSTLEGALLLQGRGEWIAGRLRFAGDAQASPGREDALANLLNILGRRQGARTLITIG